MNYRHIYHAGNICDVVKHAVLVLLLGRLKEKPTPFVVMDTHAGLGLYDLDDPLALKTGEAAAGIVKLLASPSADQLVDYRAVIAKVRTNRSLATAYPGSPVIVSELLRADDRLIACELHPEDSGQLKRVLGRYPQAQVHNRDGYEALGALLPPTEKRGLILIDPPFEQPDEFASLIQAVKNAQQRWPQGQIAIWYPIKERPTIWRFHEALANLQLPKCLIAEFIYREEVRADQLNGCGFVFINAPWQLDQQLRELFPALYQALGTEIQQTVIKDLAV